MLDKKIQEQIKALNKKSINSSNCEQIIDIIIKLSLKDTTYSISNLLSNYYLYKRTVALNALLMYIKQLKKTHKHITLYNHLQHDYGFIKSHHQQKWFIWHNQSLLFNIANQKYHHVRLVNQYDVKNIMKNLVKLVK